MNQITDVNCEDLISDSLIAILHKHIENKRCIFPLIRSWFLESTEVYSPLIMIKMICYTGILACSVFQLDLVSRNNKLN